ncbi:MTH1187 family thiamine-binding protein [Neobacillus vireti]|uniref:MTH1187 family thiamine-binding protein n=1 Tax=Neobacillus vireti TaxID=220686 RepID=UPI002FFDA2EC
MPLLEISIVPVGTDSTSISSQVIDAVQIIEEKDLKYEVTPTATVLEGDIDDLWEVAKEMHQTALDVGPERIVTTITIDHRTDKQMEMEQQIDKVEDQLD